MIKSLKWFMITTLPDPHGQNMGNGKGIKLSINPQIGGFISTIFTGPAVNKQKWSCKCSVYARSNYPMLGRAIIYSLS